MLVVPPGGVRVGGDVAVEVGELGGGGAGGGVGSGGEEAKRGEGWVTGGHSLYGGKPFQPGLEVFFLC